MPFGQHWVQPWVLGKLLSLDRHGLDHVVIEIVHLLSMDSYAIGLATKPAEQQADDTTRVAVNEILEKVIPLD